MRINKLEQNNYVNFGAVKVATAKNTIHEITTQIDIYKLQPCDKSFLEIFSKSINFFELLPKLSTELVARWHKVFNYCVEKAFYGENTTYLAISDDKPCGIITYVDDKTIFLDGICSIPVGINKKVPLVGETLFYQVLKDADKNNAKSIELEAITDGSASLIPKYKKWGLKCKQNAIPNYVEMYCNKYKIEEQIERISGRIDYIECEPEKTDLNQFLT